MEFSDLLAKQGIDPKQVLLLRHRPFEPELRRKFLWIAGQRPDLFNVYQQTQSAKLEKAMTRSKFVASFIGRDAGEALFIGLYEIGKFKPMSHAEYWDFPAHQELKAFGMEGFQPTEGRDFILQFDLSLTPFYEQWKGKLTVSWPPPEISWWRYADRNGFHILSILKDSLLDPEMPEWDRIRLSWEDLKLLPKSWQDRLSQWRGVYYIFDSVENRGYVGAAYGKNNMLQRWNQYAASGHGGNRLLKKCDPQNFSFSILQLLAPTLPIEEVAEIETRWKIRLNTRAPHGLNDN